MKLIASRETQKMSAAVIKHMTACVSRSCDMTTLPKNMCESYGALPDIKIAIIAASLTIHDNGVDLFLVVAIILY